MSDESYPEDLRYHDAHDWVRINGDTVLEYDQLENLNEGSIELQAHRPGYWTEFKNIRIKELPGSDAKPEETASKIAQTVQRQIPGVEVHVRIYKQEAPLASVKVTAAGEEVRDRQ